ncbi:hypothetical protein [Heyndrickxia sporothermodurans]|uniref:hypothetical protein n=1 Tax=Heyndrickxia sporothermodurans TaxID=46224 RepID=UPI001365E170|nr:hypothetical protein [Heyndrickxia sporothermodurans]MBL5767868.1 hypothetical protein [Heyndrickxia sporothermodurans]MBL5771468.1 hypothetical protein [Heyndrickxia sporothermodurans]MBL5812488.1 hypothetical protein [Heyndrickxia sporothermodurans]MBL5831719.1 hypothetical protein [Heyndrickxia sporothermodurans]MBL5866641.1 hypothetical protein [Heyndrickxia sporothermodurans]
MIHFNISSVTNLYKTTFAIEDNIPFLCNKSKEGILTVILTRMSRKPKFGVRVGHSKQARFYQHIPPIRCRILVILAINVTEPS